MKPYPLAPDAPPELAATWLHENGWTLAEVLEAYAGGMCLPCIRHLNDFNTCPTGKCYADGLPQAVLAAYCRLCDPDRERAEKVEELCLNGPWDNSQKRPYWAVFPLRHEPPPNVCFVNNEPAARLALKRIILRLFADVGVQAVCCLCSGTGFEGKRRCELCRRTGMAALTPEQAFLPAEEAHACARS